MNMIVHFKIDIIKKKQLTLKKKKSVFLFI